nr:glycosyltransferase family 64 protein C4 [Ipomoea batatas]
MAMRASVFSRRTLRQGAIVSAGGSVRIKLLLSCCVFFTLIALASRAAWFMEWKQQNSSPLHQPSLHRKGYTILINTWKRNDLLMQSVSHYSSCPGLDSIHIVWSEPDPPSVSLVEYLKNVIHSRLRHGRRIELKFDINTEDSLNNRFKELTDSRTDAVFSIDDDVIFPCSSVEFAFNIWRSAPDTMVGFVPRVHWIDQSKGNADKYIYGGWWSVWWMGTYSMVLSKAAFFHRKNCEDIAMSFLVANATNSPPIWVQGKIFEIGSTGISSLGGHSEKRTHCVNRFVAEYGRMPLVSTSVKAVDSRGIWFW